MEDFSAFAPGERALLEALNRRGVRFMFVGAGAAVLQGANTATQDIDLWFERVADPAIAQAVREAHGVWVSGSFDMRPPQIGGDAIGDRFDVVTHMHGLGSFEEEWRNSFEVAVDGIPVRILRLERIIASKRATGRSKDAAALPALEEALAAIKSREPDRP